MIEEPTEPQFKSPGEPIDPEFPSTQTETPSHPPEIQSDAVFSEPPPKSGATRWLTTLKTRSQETLKKITQKPDQEKLKENLQKAIQNFDPHAALEWVSKTVQKRGTSFYGTLATLTLSAYFIADLTALMLEEYIPDPPITRSNRYESASGQTKSVNDYAAIFSRNLFNSQGLIPGEDTGDSPSSDLGGPPTKSTLPLNLVGTLIMSNEALSIATIEDKSLSIVYPVRMDDEVPNKIKIVKVEPKRVVFVNKASGRREYIELPEDLQNVGQTINIGRSSAVGSGIEKVAPTQFNVSRSEVDRTLADFNNILTQARAVPNFENGVASGYKLFQIVPGSIYDKLGLQNGDVIAGLNGQPINDPAKAFELLGELKTSNHMELQVKKDGRQSTYTYDIH